MIVRHNANDRHARAHVLRAIATASTAAICVSAHVATVWGFTIDDAYIVLRYADRIAAGRGWTMNDGPWTDGITGPLFGVLLAAARAAGVDGLVAAKTMGAIGAAVAAAITVHAMARRTAGLALSLGTAMIVTGASAYCVWAVGGLETGLAALAVVVAIEGAIARPARRTWIVVGALAVPWLRPECVPVLLAVALVLARSRRDIAAWLALTALGSALLLVAARLAVFGHPLPLSARAKPAELLVGLDYVLRALLATTSGVGIVLAIAAAFGRRDDRVRASAFAALVLTVAIAGGDWMPSWRLLVPA
ncbi:MAG: hypothetical protein IT379_20285, partial [Deltaproteobacteria bacterium]|nr:hypothetical protein [Deltaproteobacteria bacterium]